VRAIAAKAYRFDQGCHLINWQSLAKRLFSHTSSASKSFLPLLVYCSRTVRRDSALVHRPGGWSFW